MIKKLVIGLSAAALIATVHAASTASDNASNPPYGGSHGWNAGDNGGTGFGAWSTVTQGFIGSSTSNGTSPSGGIDTGGVSFGLFSNTGAQGTAEASRPFTGNMTVGQTFNLAFDNGFVGNGGTVGFGLMSGTTPRFEYFFVGGNNNYTVSGSTGQTTTHGFTADGMQTAFTLTGTDTFKFTISFNSGTPTTETFTGTLKGTAGTAITGFRLFDSDPNQAPAGSDAFYNSPTLVNAVPEPSMLSLLAGPTLLAGYFFLRRRRAS